MKVKVFEDRREMGRAAARIAVDVIRETIAGEGSINIVAATGSSQFDFLDDLTAAGGIDWKQVTFFHLDEYVDLPATHQASFRRYLKERIVDRVHPGTFHFIEGDTGDPQAECRRLADLIRSAGPIHLVFLGIGENGHLAFNDPPADFDTEEPFLVVNLDEACRRQQLGEGWFPTFDAVPKQAITMSIRQIMKGRQLLCIAPDERKAEPVRNCLEGPVTPQVPCSIMREHPNATLFLDRASTSLLRPETLARYR